MTSRMLPLRMSDNGPASTPGRRPKLCPCCDESPCLFEDIAKVQTVIRQPIKVLHSRCVHDGRGSEAEEQRALRQGFRLCTDKEKHREEFCGCPQCAGPSEEAIIREHDEKQRSLPPSQRMRPAKMTKPRGVRR